MNVRVETSPPPGIEETPEGFLRFWLRIADPSAVYEYPDGLELRASDTV